MTNETNPDSGIEDFGYAASEPISFKLQGQTFHAKRRLGGKRFLRLVQRTSQATGDDAIDAIEEFLSKILKPESWDRMQAAMDSEDPDEAIDMAQVGKVVRWLIAKVSGRPTASATESATPQSSTGDSSVPDSSSTDEPASTTSPSESSSTSSTSSPAEG